MDFTIQWTLGVLKDLLPAPALAFLTTHLLDPSSPFQALRRQLSALLAQLTSGMYTVLAPMISRVAQAVASSPDVVVLAVFLAVILLIVQVLSYMQRMVLFWTRLALRMLFWSAVVLLGAVAWQRGLEATARDAMYVGSKLLGFAAGVRDVFMKEYNKYEELERLRKQTGGGPGGRARGW